MAQKDKLKASKNKLRGYIKKNYPNVVGIGISEKTTKGKKTGTLALTIYVEHKESPELISKDSRLDLDSTIVNEVGGLAFLDIKEIGKIVKMAIDHKARNRPPVVGMSEGHYQITAGTSGVLVTSGTGRYRVSNNHVYANENLAKLGDFIYQPGPYDGGQSSDTVGVLYRFVPIDFNGPNLVDAAIRTIGTGEVDNVICNIDRKPTKTSPANLNDAVIKSGRTTGVTRGTITDLSLDLWIAYDGGDVEFADQILVESEGVFSQGGDSGSPIFLDTPGLDWVGLLFAGSEDGRFTICNHATDVSKLLDVTLVTSEPSPTPEPEPEPEPEPTPEPEKNNTLLFGGIGAVLLAALAFLISNC